MNKTMLIVLAVIVVLAGGYYVMNAQKSASPAMENSQVQVPTGTAQETTSGTAAPAGAAFEIQDFSFSPLTLTVKPGETVSVTNRDTASHTLTSDDGTSFDTGLLAKDQSGTFTAPTTPGTYAFHCTPHPSMKATLVVQ